MNEDICLRRAPGVCCPVPSCDNHPEYICASCGATCSDCAQRKCIQCPDYAIRIENDRAQEDGFCQELLIHVRGSDRCRRAAQ
jgi:hypothetical protein